MGHTRNKAKRRINKQVFSNPVILESIFRNLSPLDLCSSRLVTRTWNNLALQCLRKFLKKRLLLCADNKCARNLDKFIKCFDGWEASIEDSTENSNSSIPFSKATLMLDHLPFKENLDKEDPFLQGLDRSKWKKEGWYFALGKMEETLKELPKEIGHFHYAQILHKATFLYSSAIENLILTLTLQKPDVENMQYWLRHLSYQNLKELHFQITKTTPESLDFSSFLKFLDFSPQLESLGVRKLCKNGEGTLQSILKALGAKKTRTRLKDLKLEVFTDDPTHLTWLAEGKLEKLKTLSLIYLGGELRYLRMTKAIKEFLSSCSSNLEELSTQIPLFSPRQCIKKAKESFPVMKSIQLLKIEKVYREFSSEGEEQIFGFDFTKYFPQLEVIHFKDYDLYKNNQLKAFPLKDIKAIKMEKLVLPDLCFDPDLIQRYVQMFPKLRKLSLTLSILSKDQEDSILMTIFTSLKDLVELDVTIYESRIKTLDEIFLGDNNSKDTSIVSLKSLESIRIVSFNENKILGITDKLVCNGFLQMKNLKKLIIGLSQITEKSFELLSNHCEVIRLQKQIFSKSCSDYKNCSSSQSDYE